MNFNVRELVTEVHSITKTLNSTSNVTDLRGPRSRLFHLVSVRQRAVNRQPGFRSRDSYSRPTKKRAHIRRARLCSSDVPVLLTSVSLSLSSHCVALLSVFSLISSLFLFFKKTKMQLSEKNRTYKTLRLLDRFEV